jgi:hypothetical protein
MLLKTSESDKATKQQLNWPVLVGFLLFLIEFHGRCCQIRHNSRDIRKNGKSMNGHWTVSRILSTLDTKMMAE